VGQTHLECVNGACTQVSGAGNNLCYPVDSSCASEPEPRQILSVSRSSGGSVSSSPGGINCGSVCSKDFSRYITVTLSANPASGYNFDRWEGDCTGSSGCSVFTDRDRSVTAYFTGGGGGGPPPGGQTQCNPPRWSGWQVDACWDENGSGNCGREGDVARWWCQNVCSASTATNYSTAWSSTNGTKYVPSGRECPGCSKVLTSVSCSSGSPQTHKECQNNACVQVAGGGSNQCQTNNDCQSSGTEKVYGYVFIDTDRDGVLDSGEAGFSGSTVYVRNIPDNNVLYSDGTDSNGYYEMWATATNDEVRIQHPIPSGYDGTTDWSFIRALDQYRRVDFGIVASPLPAPVCTFSASPDRLIVSPTFYSTLRWSCQNALSCTINPGNINAAPPSGTQRVSPATSITYTLSCSGPGGSGSWSAPIRVFTFSGGSMREIVPQ
ncbi:MAG: hypothetical protein AAB686_02860, partial [Patescibacteria group bacterium]